LPIVVLGLDISARTNRFLTLFGRLKATMGGAGKLLYCLDCFSEHSSSHTSKVPGKQYNICCTVNYKSANIIYILECSVCGLQYVDELKQPFHKHLNGYRSDLTKKSVCEDSMGSFTSLFFFVLK
jgi:transcription elongation factor Elf1